MFVFPFFNVDFKFMFPKINRGLFFASTFKHFKALVGVIACLYLLITICHRKASRNNPFIVIVF